MRLIIILLLSCTLTMLAGCSDAGSNVDSTATYDVSLNTITDDNPADMNASDKPTVSKDIPSAENDFSVSQSIAMPEYGSTPDMTAEIPSKIEIGMPVILALQIPGVKQTVSAIMTGGKITGTVVLQHKGKSYYTNVDFAEEGGYAFGT